MTFPKVVVAQIDFGAFWHLREVAPDLFVGGMYAVVHGGWHTIIDLDGTYANDPAYALYPVVEHISTEDDEPFNAQVLPRVELLVRAAQGPVLIHCAQGVSRSPSAAYSVLRSRGIMHDVALARVVNLNGLQRPPQPFQSAVDYADREYPYTKAQP